MADEVVDPTPPARKGAIRLSTADDIRVEMAKVYREARRGEIDSQQATRLVYMLTQIAKAHELSVIEGKVAALETTTSVMSQEVV